MLITYCHGVTGYTKERTESLYWSLCGLIGHICHTLLVLELTEVRVPSVESVSDSGYSIPKTNGVTQSEQSQNMAPPRIATKLYSSAE